MMYLVKWRDLPYNFATWEDENSEFIDLKSYIDYYWVIIYEIFNISVVINLIYIVLDNLKLLNTFRT